MTLHPADSAFRARLAALLPTGTLRDPEPRYLEEPRGQWQGQAGFIALPSCTEEVAIILREANAASVPVVPYGGGTGLVGGQVYPEGPAPIILSLERMNKVLRCDPSENVLVAQAGVILDDLHKAAEGVDRLFPLSIAASGTARLGGNLGTNAGGTNVLRYGNTRDLVLGLEVVLADGRVWYGLTRLRKDNTGYDLRNLMVGSEGTLGVITAASLKLFPRPSSYATALLEVPSPQAALDLLALTRQHAGDAVSAFELISGQGYHFLDQTMPQVRIPLQSRPEWSVLLDLGLFDDRGEAMLETILTDGMEAGLVTDGLVAQSHSQRLAIWEVRETIPEANRMIGAIASHDISVPLSKLPAFITRADEALARIGDMRVNCFGHMGDGNLHYNVFPADGKTRADYAAEKSAITEAVHGLLYDLGGSISAEHGIGRLKAHELEETADPVKLAMMRSIKAALDPKGILNPGVLFP